MGKPKYAAVILSNPVAKLDQPYHYSIPDEIKLKVGMRVLVPFGRRQEVAYVIELLETAEVDKVKPIEEVLSNQIFFDEAAVVIARHIAEHYCSFFMKALRLFMPPGTRGQEKIPGKNKKSRAIKARHSGQVVAPACADATITIAPGFPPTKYQQTALDLIAAAVKNNRPDTILLSGVTGAGKTEVYLQAVAAVVKAGGGAIILVPEIILTPQLIERFQEKFSDHLVCLHSAQTVAHRRLEWGRVVSGEARIVLGTRSALFAPVKNLGMIVLDEEFENTYKADQSPRYHARTVAQMLSQQKKIPLILGSATPSLESFDKAQRGEYLLVEMPERIGGRPLPPVKIVDMRRELKTGNYSMLSRGLRESLGNTLRAREQAILFLNRLGYFTFVMCRDCGKTVECPHCSISLSYYQKQEKLVCNRCGYRTPAAVVCPNCNSANIKFFGSGLQKLEKEIATSFPKARILCLDSQSVSDEEQHVAIYGAFKSGAADILLGTQLVTKGLDLSRVTLAGIIAADTALNLPDFRAAEHTFQQIVQVAGRVGRHHLPGKVFVQTYMPEHFAIICAAQHDYKKFFEEEMLSRRAAEFPPCVELIKIVVADENESFASDAADTLVQALSAANKKSEIEILGPAPAPVAKIRGRYRYQILIKTNDLPNAIANLRDVLHAQKLSSSVNLTIDVDPQNML